MNERNIKISVIIAAAGASVRLGFGDSMSKQFILLNGKPLLLYSLEKFSLLENLSEIIVVTNDIKNTNELIDKFAPKKNISIKAVLGGELRQDSVYNGFCNVDETTDIVIIHDVARPLFELHDIKKCIEITLHEGNAILALPIVDTLKKVCKKKSNNDRLVVEVEKTVDRDGLYAIQTPQVFNYQLLKDVYKTFKAKDYKTIITDESMMLELSGKPVNLVPVSRKNIKITYQEDLELAKVLLIGAQNTEIKGLKYETEICSL